MEKWDGSLFPSPRTSGREKPSHGGFTDQLTIPGLGTHGQHSRSGLVSVQTVLRQIVPSITSGRGEVNVRFGRLHVSRRLSAALSGDVLTFTPYLEVWRFHGKLCGEIGFSASDGLSCCHTTWSVAWTPATTSPST